MRSGSEVVPQMLNTTGWRQVLLAAKPRSLRRRIMKNLFVRLWREEEGQDLTEYALLVVLIALAAVTGMKSLAGAISNTFANAAANLNT